MTNDRKDVYSRVTDRIIADLERGVRTWMKPWSAENTAGRICRPLRHNGIPYQGMNVLLLWGEAVEKGYTAPIWLTYKQAQELGGNVRKGEKSALVVYANKLTRTETGDQGEEIEKQIPFMKAYAVFNVQQVEGLPAHYYGQPENPLPLSERLEQVESFVANTGADIRHGGNSAFYAPSKDLVQMPPFEAFKDKESYYATLLHELSHWTSHKSRLDRSFNAKRFGDHGYAREELVAELGAAFLSADLGITPEVREDHAAYLDHWLQEDELGKSKADVYRKRYENFRSGLSIKKKFIDLSAGDELKGVTFAFVCVDNGDARAEIFSLLISMEIPFIDVGMGLDKKHGAINGMMRMVYYSTETADELQKKGLSPLSENPNNIYKTNIQIGELNALNACLAVVKFKQIRGFYHEESAIIQALFEIADMKIVTDGVSDGD